MDRPTISPGSNSSATPRYSSSEPLQLFLPSNSPGHACRVFQCFYRRIPCMKFPTKPERFNKRALNISVCLAIRVKIPSGSNQGPKCSRAWTKVPNNLWLLGARAGRSGCEPLPPPLRQTAVFRRLFSPNRRTPVQIGTPRLFLSHIGASLVSRADSLAPQGSPPHRVRGTKTSRLEVIP